MHPFKLYAKGLEKTGIYENIILCLKCLENLTIKNQQVYNTIENLKNEFYIYGIKRKMDELTVSIEYNSKLMTTLNQKKNSCIQTSSGTGK